MRFLVLTFILLSHGAFGTMKRSQEESHVFSQEEPPQKKHRNYKRKILVISMDYDGCLSFTPFSFDQVLVPDSKVKLLLFERCAAPVGLLAYLDQKIKKGGHTEIILCVGSNRQSEYTNKDCQVKNKNGDCYACMKDLCRRLTDHMDIPVSFHQMLTADLHYNLASGTHMEKRHNSPLMTVFDKHKLVLHTMFIHSVYKEFALGAGDQLEYAVFEDRKDLLDRIQLFYQLHKDLIPKECLLTTIGMIGPYVGFVRNIKNPKKSLSRWKDTEIKGTGKSFDPKKVWPQLVFGVGVVRKTRHFIEKFSYCYVFKRPRKNDFLFLKTQLESAIGRAYLDNTSLRGDSALLVASDRSLQEIEEDTKELEFSLACFLSESSIDRFFADFMKEL
jgi:hypothetical protein